MHEFSLANQIFIQLQEMAVSHNMAGISRVTIQAGRMRQIVPEALDAAFEAIVSGTVADGAALQLEIIEPLVECRACGHRFAPETDSFQCAECGQADVDIVEGNDIIIRSVEYEEDSNG